MTTNGYYRFPTICKNSVVFVAEDDLWQVPAKGGVARRLTANLGRVSHPVYSPNGKQLAFIGREDGEAELYVMPAEGGPATRLTYLGGNTAVLGWTPDGQQIVFSSNASQPFAQMTMLYTLSPAGGQPQQQPYGPARSIAFGPQGQVVLGRHALNLAYWKRYRGGRAGDIWIDGKGKGNFKPLLKLKASLIKPMWLQDRIYFLSDHEGVGNLYSCTPRGTKIQRHTHHADFCVRQPLSDGQRVVYSAGADLYIFDPTKEQANKKASQQIKIKFHSPRVQRNRKFVSASTYLGHYSISPQGQTMALNTRGKAFSFANWDGAAFQYGQSHGARYRLVEWLNDGKRLVMVSDAGAEETLEIHHDASQDALEQSIERLDGLSIGRPTSLTISPRKDELVLTNHQYELIYVDLKNKTAKVLDRSDYGPMAGVDWSRDGQWLVYGFRSSMYSCAIKLHNFESGQTHYVTRPNDMYDVGPSFDPAGKYIYFISYRDFDPVYDSHYFDLNFPQGSRPYLVTLQNTLPNPFIGQPQTKVNGPNHKNGDKKENGEENDKENGKDKKENAQIKPWQIDLDNIQTRVVAFPVSEGRYHQIRGAKEKVYFTSFPVEGSLNRSWHKDSDDGKGALEMYNLKERKKEYVVSGVSAFELSRDRKFLFYRSNKNLRVLKVGEKPDNNASGYNKKSGWIQLGRLRVAINPPDEWRQMFREAWRLQRDNFWTEDMSSVDWEQIYKRYYPLIDRVATRSEFSDLLWEMQGELGTSHAYELGGDYRRAPRYNQGLLGANFAYDAEHNGYRISHIVQGDSWRKRGDSSLHRLGANIQEGDVLLAIDGQCLSQTVSPQQLLVNRAGIEIQLTVLSANQDKADETDNPRRVLVKTLSNDTSARYREWVENNRRYVHEKTQGKVGYVHIPDMGPGGFAEFHRYYRMESEYEGLLVDVRYNGGGHVSQLLIEKLARRRLGYRQARHGKVWAYPHYAVLGPMVTLTNEYAGSDGDIFSHVFKLMGLGPLIGKRTWGGVVGIRPRHSLVDGTITTQPEVSTWFEDVGWGVENYGTDPDIEVEFKPQDYAKGKDPQMERGLKEILQMLTDNPPQVPEFGPKPSLALPKLPKMKKKK